MLGISQVQVAVLLFRTRKQLQKEIKSQSAANRGVVRDSGRIPTGNPPRAKAARSSEE